MDVKNTLEILNFIQKAKHLCYRYFGKEATNSILKANGFEGITELAKNIYRQAEIEELDKNDK